MIHDTNPLDNLLIKQLIAQYLSPKDLSNCVMVSKHWSTIFAPLLWKNFYLSNINGNKDKEQGLSTISRHGYHAQSVTINYDHMEPYMQFLPEFPNIRSLNYITNSPLDSDIILSAIITSSQLSRLSLSLTGHTLHSSETLVQLLSAQISLSYLELNLNAGWDIMIVPLLLKACPLCQTFRLRTRGFKGTMEDFGCDDDEGGYEELAESTYLAVSKELNNMRHENIQEFSLDLSSLYQWMSLGPSLLRCLPSLERLSLSSITSFETVCYLADLFKLGQCPKVKHLTLHDVAALPYPSSDGSIMDLTQSFNTISTHNSNRQMKREPLESFSLSGSPNYTISCESSLLTCHAMTMTHLSLNPMSPVEFEQLIKIGVHMPNLRSFDGFVHIGCTFNTPQVSKLPELVNQEWSCLNLERFGLTPKLRYDYRKREDSLVPLCTNYLFEQLSRMAKLQTLEFKDKLELLMMEEGYVRKLEPLKSLDRIYLYDKVRFCLKEQEAIYLKSIWPELKSVGANYSRHRGEDGISDQSLDLFLSTLRTLAPRITIE